MADPQESPTSPPNSLQGIVANRRHGKPATSLQVVRWHTHHTLTACHRWRRQAEPADIMQAVCTMPDTLPPISMIVEAGTCRATGKPASLPNSLQGIVAHRLRKSPPITPASTKHHIFLCSFRNNCYLCPKKSPPSAI